MFDLLVVGGGIAGMSAAAKAAQNGASVAVIEKQTMLGGSGLYASYLWTAGSEQEMLDRNPECEPGVCLAPVQDAEQIVAWIEALGVNLGRAVRILEFGRGRTLDVAGFVSACAQAVRSAPAGTIRLQSTVQELLFDDGAVVGARIAYGHGETGVILARSTLLATGGFAGSPLLREELIHPQAREMPARVNPGSVGDGLRLARTAGADTVIPGAGFYGHLMPSHVPLREPSEFHDYTFFHSEHSLLFNIRGERFCDETIADHLSAQTLMAEPEARALMITDARVQAQWMMKPYVSTTEPVDKFALAYRNGARCAIAEEVNELEYLPPEWGYPGGRIRDIVITYNQTAAQAQAPGRARDDDLLLDPPYYLIEVVPAVTIPYVGVRVDPEGHVLNPGGDPIPGLLAAGADAGGVYFRQYTGGLMPAVAYGLRAAHVALGRANGRSIAERQVAGAENTAL